MNRALLAFSIGLMSSGCSEMMDPKFEIGEYVEVDVEGLVGRVDRVDCMAVAILPEHKNCSLFILDIITKQGGRFYASKN